MKNFDESVKINHNTKWPYVPDHFYRLLIIGGSGSMKTNMLLNVIKHQRPDIDNIYLYIKDPFETKYQLLFNGREKLRSESLKNPKACIDHSQLIDDVYENLEGYNPTKKRRVLIVFDNMTADVESNKKLSPIVNEFFFERKKTQYFTHFYTAISFQGT